MPDQHQNLTPVVPAELPPETWLTYDQFSHLLPGMSKRIWETGSVEGRLPASTRFTPKSPRVYKAGAVAAWLALLDAEVSK